MPVCGRPIHGRIRPPVGIYQMIVCAFCGRRFYLGYDKPGVGKPGASCPHCGAGFHPGLVHRFVRKRPLKNKKGNSIIKRCKVWRGDWRDGADRSDCEASLPAACQTQPWTYGNLPVLRKVSLRPGRGVILGRTYCIMRGELRLRLKRAIIQRPSSYNNPSQSRPFSATCARGVWGRAETVRRIKERSGWLLCPDCRRRGYEHEGARRKSRQGMEDQP